MKTFQKYILFLWFNVTFTMKIFINARSNSNFTKTEDKQLFTFSFYQILTYFLRNVHFLDQLNYFKKNFKYHFN